MSLCCSTLAYATTPLWRCLLNIAHTGAQALKKSVDFYGVKEEHPKLDRALHMLGDPSQLAPLQIENTTENYIRRNMSHATEGEKYRLRRQIALGALKSKRDEIRIGTLELVKRKTRDHNEIQNVEEALNRLIEKNESFETNYNFEESLNLAIRSNFNVTANGVVPYFRLIRRNVVRSTTD